MNRLNFTPYSILWSTIPLLFLPILFGRDNALDLQFHDTYFVLDSLVLAVLFAIVLGILGGLYWVFKSFQLNKNISLLHAYGSSISAIVLAFIPIIQTPARSGNTAFFNALIQIGVGAILILLCLQIVFILNLLFGLIKGKAQP